MNLFKNDKVLAALAEYVRQQNALLPDADSLSEVALSEWFHQRMHQLIARRKRGFYVLFGTIGRRVASIVIAVLVAATVTTVSVEALRKPVAEFFTQVFEKFTQVFFVDDTPDTPEVEMEKRVPSYIPEGYTIENELNVRTLYKTIYANEQGKTISYTQRWKRAGELIADTEGVQYTVIEVNGYEGITYNNKEYIYLIFSDAEYTYTVSGNLTYDKLLEITESIL